MAMFQSMLKDLIDGPAKTVWVRQGLPPDDLQNLRLTEAPDPSVDSSFKLGTAAQVRPRQYRNPYLLMMSPAVFYWPFGSGGCPLSLSPDG